MNKLAIAAGLVEQLEDYLEDREDLSISLVPSLTWSTSTLEISIGDIPVYCSEINDELSFEACKREWQEYLNSLKPYFD